MAKMRLPSREEAIRGAIAQEEERRKRELKRTKKEPRERAKEQLRDLVNKNELNPRIDDPGEMPLNAFMAGKSAKQIQDAIRHSVEEQRRRR